MFIIDIHKLLCFFQFAFINADFIPLSPTNHKSYEGLLVKAWKIIGLSLWRLKASILLVRL